MKQLTSGTFRPSCSKHTLHRDSHTITKLKPKIRIIHIIAPEIIKTDVENFRELVQRLTGNHAEEFKGKKVKKERNYSRKNIESMSQERQQQHQQRQQQHNIFQDMSYRMKEEEISEGTYEDVENSSNGLLSGFGMEGYIQYFGEFPLFPFMNPSQINMFGEMPLC